MGKMENDQETQNMLKELEQVNKDNEEAQKLQTNHIESLHKALEALKNEYDLLKSEKAGIASSKQYELMKLTTELQEAKCELAEKGKYISNLKSNNDDLVMKIETLYDTHDEELGDLVDVVNELKVKENEVDEARMEINDLVKQIQAKEKHYQELIARIKVENEHSIERLKMEYNAQISAFKEEFERNANHLFKLKDGELEFMKKELIKKTEDLEDMRA